MPKKVNAKVTFGCARDVKPEGNFCADSVLPKGRNGVVIMVFFNHGDVCSNLQAFHSVFPVSKSQ